MKKIKVVKIQKVNGKVFKWQGFPEMWAYLTEAIDTYKYIKSEYDFHSINRDNCDDCIDTIDRFIRDNFEGRYSKYAQFLPKYIDECDEEYSRAKECQEANEYDYYKYEMGYSMERLKLMFEVEDF